MQIEVTVGSEEPVRYALKGSKLILGSGENASYVIPSSAGISRKHVEFSIDGDRVFVTDLGSSNGTFINEERLVPGSKKEFTSFFPLRLADDVWVTLITDDDEPAMEPNTLQAAIKIPTPQPQKEAGTKTTLKVSGKSIAAADSAIKLKIEAREKNQKAKGTKAGAAPAKKSQTSGGGLKAKALVICAMLAGAAVYHFKFREQDPNAQLSESEQPQPKPMPKVQPPPEPPLIEASRLATLEEIRKAFDEFKCMATVEKSLCDIIPDATYSFGGVVGAIGRLFILLPENKFYRMTLQTVPDKVIDLKERTQFIFLTFLKTVPNYNWKELEKDVYFVFYRSVESRPVVGGVVAVKSSQLEGLHKKVLALELAQEINLKGKAILNQYTTFFLVMKATMEPEPEPAKPPEPVSAPVAASPAAAPAPPQAPRVLPPPATAGIPEPSRPNEDAKTPARPPQPARPNEFINASPRDRMNAPPPAPGANGGGSFIIDDGPGAGRPRG